MSRVALLDVNVLVALFNPVHVHHELAHDWFADHRASGWATCPLTENGFLRIFGNPARGALMMPIPELIARLRKFCASGHHEFWEDAVSLSDQRLFHARFARGHRQLTDVYLLGLATRKRGRLVTFDRTIPLAAVIGASRATLEVVSSAD